MFDLHRIISAFLSAENKRLQYVLLITVNLPKKYNKWFEITYGLSRLITYSIGNFAMETYFEVITVSPGGSLLTQANAYYCGTILQCIMSLRI